MLQRVTSVRSVATVILCAALVVSCSSDPDSDDDPTAEAYILVVDWVLAEPEYAMELGPDELAVIYVESLGPAEIELGVQVHIVGHFEDRADVRFIDSRDEALKETDGAPVSDGALLLGLGAVPMDGSWEIRGEIYRTSERIAGYRFRIDQSGPTARLIGPPDQVEPEGLVADQ